MNYKQHIASYVYSYMYKWYNNQLALACIIYTIATNVDRVDTQPVTLAIA